jgi:hypothetical protein
MSDTALRNADLSQLVEALRSQQARKIDVVVPATALWSRNENFRVVGADGVSANGEMVLGVDGLYQPTAVFDEGVAAKTGFPSAYLRKLRSEGRGHLIDGALNELLQGYRAEEGKPYAAHDADSRSFLLRLFRGDDDQPGVARALLSDKYKMIENLDVLMAALDGVRDTGTDIVVKGADLTDRRMYVRIMAPGIQALAPELLKDYRSPFSGARGADNPTVFAGFRIANSETGGGAFTITPELTVQVCTNGMTITRDAMRSVHLGGKQEDGVVDWSARTNQLALELVKSRTSDMVRTCLNTDYMNKVIREATEKAGKPVEKAADTIKVVAKQLAYTADEQEGILDHFIKGSDTTAGGLMNAVTSFSQTVADADRAADLDGTAMRILDLV